MLYALHLFRFFYFGTTEDSSGSVKHFCSTRLVRMSDALANGETNNGVPKAGLCRVIPPTYLATTGSLRTGRWFRLWYARRLLADGKVGLQASTKPSTSVYCNY
jgi:hypothetical protein